MEHIDAKVDRLSWIPYSYMAFLDGSRGQRK